MLDLEKLKDSLIRHEGLKLKPYRCSAGKLTIGVGRNLDDMGIAEEEALALLEYDLARLTGELDRALPWWRSLDGERALALADLAFNVGLTRLTGFKRMLAAMEAGEFETARAELLDSRWAAQVGTRARELAALIGGEG